MATQTETDTDARQWEYVTYAPAGETCPACMVPRNSARKSAPAPDGKADRSFVMEVDHGEAP
ncbi:hypothetical protein SCWH03_22820 [Streptomyces pacificus]|uniref:Uncharacterized protein n=1 Tax=Streptomyces pacificus TaxID=2705029 RepID=A0A6A0AT46_9ACTN|nr:hypothetical protein SCWH03_22820 [Streptomyces pacificus]